MLLIILLSATFLASNQSMRVAGQPVSSSLLQQKTQAACSFLKSLYDPSLRLVRSTPNSNVYYIASDNILAERAISYCDQATSQAINQSISSCCGTGYDRMHEALLGVKIPLPIIYPLTYTVADSSAGRLFRGVTPATYGGNYTVLWEYHNATGTFPDCTYADVTVYTALELRFEGNTTGARHEMDCLAIMYDGRGMADEAYKGGPFTQYGLYQTYKLALYIYALLKVSGSFFYAGEWSLLRSQGPDGGFHTGYDQSGTYAGTQENAETTSVAIIAMSGLSMTTPLPFPVFSISSWAIYFITVWIVISLVVVAFVLFYEQRRRKKSLQRPFQAFPSPS